MKQQSRHAGVLLLLALSTSACSSSSSTGYKEFYSCVGRVSDLPDRVKVAQARVPGGISEAQVRAYYAQFPLGKTEQDSDSCYAQHWRIPVAVSVSENDGVESISMRFPLIDDLKPGHPIPATAVEGLGTADVTVSRYSGGVPGRYLYARENMNDDGSIQYDPETDELVRDEKAGFDLIVQKRKPDVGGRMVEGIPIDRSDHLRISGNIPWGIPISYSAVDGISVTSALDDRWLVSYYVGSDGMPRLRQIDQELLERIRGFMVNPQRIESITAAQER